jgi:flagellar motility protein MotE (MotC chaperone)
MRFRVLPVLIVFAIMMLGIRVGEIWQGVGSVAEAQSDVAATADMVRDPLSNPPTSVLDGPQLAQAGDETPQTGSPPTSSRAELAAIPSDPLQMSDEEIELLQQLGDRRQDLEDRAIMLDRREQMLQAAERRLDDKVLELAALKETIEELLTQYDDQQDRQVERLVNIYESMKAKDAARIFEDLEMPVLLRVVDRMSERRTAPILAEMASDKAQALTLELAERQELPIPRD